MKKIVTILSICLSVAMFINIVSINAYAASDSIRGKYLEGSDDEIGFYACGDTYYDEIFGYIVCNNSENKGLSILSALWYQGRLQTHYNFYYDITKRVQCSYQPEDETMIILVVSRFLCK